MMESQRGSLSKLEQLDSFIIRWNNRFPFDYWWRKKYGVPFNSKRHRRTSLIDMYLEYREEHLLRKGLDDERTRKERAKKYRETGEFLRPRSSYADDVPQGEIEQDFENMEI